MFNAKQKEQFLNTIDKENTYNAYVVVFNKCENIESALEKDIADMTLTEIRNLLDIGSGKSAQSSSNFRSMLSTYVDWCIRNGKSIMTENNVSKISYTSIDKQRSYKSSYVGSDKEMFEVIQGAFPDSDMISTQGITSIRRSIILLFYIGMESKEIMLLKKDDIDYENGIIHSPLYENVIYKADENLLYYLRVCSDLEEIEYSADQRKKPEALCKNEYVYRSRVGKGRPFDYSGTVTNSFIWKRCEELNTGYEEATGIYKKLTPSTISESKRFIDYRAASNKEEFLSNYRVELSIKTTKNERQLYMSILNFKKDYQAWEKAFH